MFKYTLVIKGMRCSMCEAHINDVIRKEFDVKKVKSNHKKNITSFQSNDLIEDSKIKEVIDSTGYELVSVDIN